MISGKFGFTDRGAPVHTGNCCLVRLSSLSDGRKGEKKSWKENVGVVTRRAGLVGKALTDLLNVVAQTPLSR
jgi:hypothetical protein